MQVLSRVLTRLWLLAALALPVTSPRASEELPDLDPTDPATCEHEQGFVVVSYWWTIAWHRADQAGQLGEPRATDLAIWYLEVQNYAIDSNDVKGACLALVESRRAHSF